MKKHVRLFLLCVLAVLAAGCATRNQMGLRKSDTTLDLSQTSIALLTVRLDHAYRPSITPYARVVHVEKPDAKEKEDRQNFVVDAEANAVGPDGQDYLVRMALPPGKYRLMGVSGGGGLAIFPGFFLLPLVTDIDIAPGKVIYLGRIEARTRERGDTEFRAGPLLPLIDQAATGWSQSTWDITIRDAYESDMQRFRTAFPALQGAQVQKSVMTFDRARAQAWWERQ